VIAITGAGGYIGGAVTRHLSESGQELSLLVRSKSAAAPTARLIEADLADPAALRALVAECDTVIHAAARLGSGSQSAFNETNVTGSARVARAAARSGARRFVYLSSIECYGRFSGRVLDESLGPALCGHPYADSKARSEWAILDSLRGSKCTAILLRIGMVYGPGRPYWTTRLAEDALAGRLRVIGHRGQAFPVFIDDVVDAVVNACNTGHPASTAINIAAGSVAWWRWYSDIADALEAPMPKNEPTVVANLRALTNTMRRRPARRRHIEVMTRTGTIPTKKAAELIGWKARRSYADGMREAMQWYVGEIERR
jgi:nucleoside-diphosphate-sugar epimerase